MSAKTPIAKETISEVPYSTSHREESITHLGITYSITHHAHQSDAPLETCVHCGGSGKLYTRKCKDCRGLGMVVRKTSESSAYQYSSTYPGESESK